MSNVEVQVGDSSTQIKRCWLEGDTGRNFIFEDLRFYCSKFCMENEVLVKLFVTEYDEWTHIFCIAMLGLFSRCNEKLEK